MYNPVCYMVNVEFITGLKTFLVKFSFRMVSISSSYSMFDDLKYEIACYSILYNS